jgi:predicted metal-dependent HD superfamily phosphohydrolase
MSTFEHLPLDEQALLTTLLSQSHRTYHNINHINDCLVEMYDVLKFMAWDNSADANDWFAQRMLTWAIWYHDVIYNPYAPAGLNEQMSAELFITEQKKRGLRIKDFDSWEHRTRSLIQVTAEHLINHTAFQPPKHKNALMGALMLDIDLAGFGHPYSTYVRNSINVQKEYYRTLPLDFLKGRHKFLTTLTTSRSSLYYTDFFRNKYHERALMNITEDLLWLEDALTCEEPKVYVDHQTEALSGYFDNG